MNADCEKSVVAAVAEIPIPRTEPSTEYLPTHRLTQKEKPKAEKLKQVIEVTSIDP